MEQTVLILIVVVAATLILTTAIVSTVKAETNTGPDKDCVFNPNGLAKCKPDPTTSKCPSGFSANDKGNCFPKGPCPSGYVRKDNDESAPKYC